MAGVSRIQRDAAAMPEVPPHAWPLCPAELLAETLTAEPGPALVEFWAAAVLFFSSPLGRGFAGRTIMIDGGRTVFETEIAL